MRSFSVSVFCTGAGHDRPASASDINSAIDEQRCSRAGVQPVCRGNQEREVARSDQPL
jgi:hypothetical protein